MHQGLLWKNWVNTHFGSTRTLQETTVQLDLFVSYPRDWYYQSSKRDVISRSWVPSPDQFLDPPDHSGNIHSQVLLKVVAYPGILL